MSAEISVADALDTFLDNLFVERTIGKKLAGPRSPQRTYVSSNGFHRHRYSVEEFNGSRSRRYSEFDLSASLSDSSGLGPYELQVLGQLLHAPNSLVMLVGHAGSGKSSTIRHVLEYYRRFRRLKPAGPVSELGAKLVRLPISHAYVDFNNVWPKLDDTDGHSEPETVKRLYELWANEIGAAVTTALEGSDVCGADELILDLFAQARGWAAGRNAPPEEFLAKDAITRLCILVPDWKRGEDSVADFYRLRGHVQSLEPADRIEFWHAMLETLQIVVRPVLGELFIVYDNADPMDGYLQVEMQRFLHGLSQRGTSKILAPVRPVAFRKRAFAIQCNWYPHSGPTPIDVVVRRLQDFLVEPEKFPSYVALGNTEHKQVARSRALELWLRLHRTHERHRGFPELVGATAGDSIRRCLLALRDVFASEALSRHYPEWAVNSYLRNNRVVGAAWTAVEQLGNALADEIVAIADEHSRDRTEQRVASQIAVRIFSTVSSVIRNATSGKYRVKPDDEMARALRVALDAPFFAEDVASALAQGRSIAEMRSFAPGEIDRLLEITIAKLTERARKEAPPAFSSEIDLRLVALEAFVRRATGQPMGTKSSASDLFGKDEYATQVLGTNKPHEMTVALVHSSYVSDLFTIQRHPSNAKLQILYALAQRPAGEQPIAELLRVLRKARLPDGDLLGRRSTTSCTRIIGSSTWTAGSATRLSNSSPTTRSSVSSSRAAAGAISTWSSPTPSISSSTSLRPAAPWRLASSRQSPLYACSPRWRPISGSCSTTRNGVTPPWYAATSRRSTSW